MAKIEIDETEYAKLQNVGNVLSRMLSNPDSRKKVLEAHKITNPNAIVPEIDATKPINDALAAISEEVKKVAKSVEDDKIEREQTARRTEFDNKWSAGKAAARKAGYTDDGLKALEEYMADKGVLDHEVAMPAFERTHPLPTQVTASREGFDAFQAINDTNEEMKRLVETQGQDPSTVRNLISKTLADVRSGGR